MSDISSSSAPPASNTATSSPDDIVLIEKYATLSRLYSYSLVQSGVGWYNYAKEYALLRKPIELTESTVKIVAKPIINKCDPLLQHVDSYGVSQLDKIESTVQTVQTKYVVPVTDFARSTISGSLATVDNTLDSVLDYGSGKIQGTKVGDLVNKSVSLVDCVVDTILPPPESEDLDHETELWNLEKRCKVFLKLRMRINKESLKNLPTNSYNGIVHMTAAKPITYAIDILDKAKDSIQDMSLANLKDETFDKIYQSLDTIAATVGSLSIWIQRFDPNEVLQSILELTKMIKNSKISVLSMADSNEKVKKFRSDFSQIVEQMGAILKENINSGMNKFEEMKTSDSAMLRQTVYLIESGIHNILILLKNITPNNLLTNSASSSSSSTPAPSSPK